MSQTEELPPLVRSASCEHSWTSGAGWPHCRAQITEAGSTCALWSPTQHTDRVDSFIMHQILYCGVYDLDGKLKEGVLGVVVDGIEHVIVKGHRNSHK